MEQKEKGLVALAEAEKMLRDQCLPSPGCGEGGLCPGALGSHGGLSTGRDVSRLLGQNILWLLWLLQGSAGPGPGSRSCGRDGQDLLLKLFILKYPDLWEDDVPLLFGDL